MRRGVAGLLLVVVVLAVGGLAVRKVQHEHHANATRRANCAEVTALGRQRNDSQPVTTGPRPIVVLGDSYAQGQHLPDPRDEAWSTQVGDLTHRQVYVNGIGGTGLTNPGPCGGQTYADRESAVMSLHPDTVIVEVGLNDTAADQDDERIAALNLLAGLPAAHLLVVGPPAAPARPSAALVRVDQALHAAAASQHVAYLSLLGEQFPYQPDRLHLTVEGHRKLAGLVAGKLR